MLTIEFEFENEEGEEEVVEFPAKYDVCGRCDGHGKHSNPAIDGNGLTREDFDNDPDFEEDYFAGVYDIRCEECAGERVVRVIDEEHCTPEQLKAVEEHYERMAERARWDAEDAHTRRMENGGY